MLIAEPSRITTPTSAYRAWAVLVIAVAAAFVAIFTASSVSVAFSAIGAELGIAIHRLHWIITLYMTVFTGFIPLSGWLGDRYGPRPILLTSFVFFLLGCILATFAQRWDVLLIARGLQALGASTIMPASIIMLTHTFTPAERGRAFGIWTLGAIAAPSLGPPLGGIIVQHLGWRMLFGVTVIITVVVWILAYWLVPKRTSSYVSTVGRFRIPSLLSFSAGTALLVLTVSSFTANTGHGDSLGHETMLPVPWWYLAMGCVLAFAYFFHSERGTVTPLFPRALVNNPVVRAALCLGIVRALGLFGPTFLLPLMLQQVMGQSPQQVGMIMSATAVMLACTSPWVGKIVDRVGARIPAMLGVGCLVVGLIAYHDLNMQSPIWLIVWPQLLRGVGLAFLINSVSVTVVNNSQSDESGRSGSLLSLTNQLSGAVSVAALNAVIAPAILMLERRDMPLLGSSVATLAFDHAFLCAAAVCALGFIPAMYLPSRSGRAPNTSRC